MHWLIIAAVIFLLLVLISRQPKLGIPLAVVLVAYAGVMIYVGEGEVSRGRNLIPPEDLEMHFVTYEPSYGSSWRFSARITNDTEHTLLAMQVRSVLFDCVPRPDGADEACHVIGEASAQVDVQVPPGQSRDIQRTINVGHSRPRGRAQW
jgi:hypothetical protein